MIPPIGGLTPITPPAPTPGADAAGGVGASGGESFGNVVTNAVDALQAAQTHAAGAEATAATGQGSLADTMIAATQASLDTEVTTSLLEKATTSYNQIMNMSF